MPIVAAALAAAAGLFSAGSLVCAVEHMFASRRVMQEAERAG
jgi:ABC-type Na+ efflux pump permease subunit